MVHDPLHLQAMSMSFALSANDLRHKSIGRAPMLQLPTLVLVGDQDEAQVGARQLYDALTVADKRWMLLPGIGHLLLNIQETPEVVAVVTQWLAMSGRC